MLKKLLIFITFLLSLNPNSPLTARMPDPYVEKLQEKKYLKLSDGREVVLVRLFNENGPSNHMRLFLRQKEKVLWDVTYHEDFETVWADAHFLPLYDKEYSSDLNSDGFSEIAVAVWHGGNAMQFCRSIIFTIEENKLAVLTTREINYEFSRSVFKSREEAILKIASPK